LRELCQQLALRGTILLAEEGINLFVAGTPDSIAALVDTLQGDPEIGPLEIKESITTYQPFNRMLVKIKREIISFGVPVAAGEPAGDKLPAAELCRWLDQGRDVMLLDTRNQFEVEVGTFEGAVSPGIGSFTEFPRYVDSLPPEWRERPIVTFCTGGIRCEKAAPYMRSRGFRHVYQLDGGILKYFEQVGGKHYRGDCFVFDQRVAVDAALRETSAAQCYACQAVLDDEDQQSPLYDPPHACPHCYRSTEAAMRETIAKRTTKLRANCDPPPGCVPYDNRRPIYVPARLAQLGIVDFLHAAVPTLSADQWRELVRQGRLELSGQAVDEHATVAAGDCYEHVVPNTIEPPINTNIQILYEDAALVVVDKPAPLPMHPSGRFNKNTLSKLLEPLYLPQRLRPAHRLDANTSGLCLFSRSRRFAQRVQAQFESAGRSSRVEKVYLAQVHGHPAQDQFACNATIAASPGEAGVRLLDPAGLAAETLFRVVRRGGDGTSLVEARPVTGRTNQIRLHLWSLGHAIVGDPTYLPNGQTAATQSLSVDDPPMCLHAWKLAFDHPISGQRVEFEAQPPHWAST
jgi:RluA family pseudouridine synthase